MDAALEEEPDSGVVEDRESGGATKDEEADVPASEASLGEGCWRIRRRPEDPSVRSWSSNWDLRVNRISYPVALQVTCWLITIGRH